MISLVVPTFREAESVPPLVERVAAVRERIAKERGQDLELLLVDDDSRDGIVEWAERAKLPWVRLIVRYQDRGLSQAVLEGLHSAQGDTLVIMDADLSHPPEVIMDMLRALDEGAELVVGSRYVQGGSTADSWGLLRRINSKLATVLAIPLTPICDPMSGFIALPRHVFERGEDFQPVGYKIGLELMVRCGCERVVEVPIHFSTRAYGESKLTFKQQVLYLQHVSRLYRYRLTRKRSSPAR